MWALAGVLRYSVSRIQKTEAERKHAPILAIRITEVICLAGQRGGVERIVQDVDSRQFGSKNRVLRVVCSRDPFAMNTTPPTPNVPHGSGRLRSSAWIGGLLLGIVVGGVLVGLASRSSEAPWSRWLKRSTNIDVSQPTVVDKIQQLQRLETVVYTLDKIVSGEKESSILPDFLAGDRLLMLVHGEVVAGVDFSSLKSGDVSVSRKQVKLHLPDAKVFSTRLDNTRTRVYSRQTGLLVPVDQNLESQVRQEAERQLLQAALTDGILKTANQNAHTTLTSLMQGLGFEKVDFH